MACLNDIEIQAVVDAEANEAGVAHAASCALCRGRVDARRRDMAAVAELMSDGSAEHALPALAARVEQAITDGRSPHGATSLRASPPRSLFASGIRSPWALGLATAAVVLLVVFVILPRFGAPTTLSASEVLGRSLKTLSGTTGVEMLEYELFVAGEMPGPHRIEQLIDHDRLGRYRFSNYGPDGVLESAIAQDPASQRRVQLIRVDGRNYIIDLNSAGGPKFSLPEMGQAMVETTIAMMQATSDQNLSIVDAPGGRQYVVEIPAVTPATGPAMLDLYHARAVINERDFRIQAFEASGSVFKQPYSISFRLIRQSVRASAEVTAGEFAIPTGPNDTVIVGASEHDPVTDAIKTVLRELGRVRGPVAAVPARQDR